MNMSYRLFGFGLVLSLVLLAGCDSEKKAAASNSASASRTVPVVKVVAQPLATQMRLPAELQPYETVATYSKVPGFVEWIGVDRGSHVTAGQLMVRLSAPELVSQRAESQSKLQAAESQLVSTQAKQAADQSTYQKLEAASHTPGVVAGNDLVLAQKTVQADEAQVKALQANVEAARQALRAVSETEKYLQIRAPFTGIVTERNVHPGALVGPNQQTPIVRIETVSRLRLVVPVPETYTAGVSEGSKVGFTVSSFPGENFTGTVARVSHSVDEKTRTMPVELDVTNSSGRLSPGTFAEVTWPVRRPKPSLFVPSSAITSNLDRTFVVRIRDGKAEWIDVKTGAVADKLTEVFGDLHENDEVAVRGTDELQPGTQVQAQEQKAN
jgi:membrane fusion protein, multidrug efflux system